ncbi:MAG: hypothetical protein WC254_04070 [Candidatus Woesearchaeota archaeon]|jgi:hypothetical protein
MNKRILSLAVLGLGFFLHSDLPKEITPKTSHERIIAIQTADQLQDAPPFSALETLDFFLSEYTEHTILTDQERKFLYGELSVKKGDISSSDQTQIASQLVSTLYDYYNSQITPGQLTDSPHSFPYSYTHNLIALREVASENGVDPTVVSEKELELLNTLTLIRLPNTFANVLNSENYLTDLSDLLSLEQLLIRDNSELITTYEVPFIKTAYGLLHTELSKPNAKPSFSRYERSLKIIQDLADNDNLDVTSYEASLVQSGYTQLTEATKRALGYYCRDNEHPSCVVPYTQQDICFLNILASNGNIDVVPYETALKNTVTGSFDDAIARKEATTEVKDLTLTRLFTGSCESHL